MTMATKQKARASLLPGDLKLHFALAAVIGLAGIALVTAGPSLTAIAAFFGPLVISTVFLLAAIAVLFWISPPPKNALEDDLPGQELMQYVAGDPVEISCGIMNLDRITDQALEGEKLGLIEKNEEGEP